MSDSKDFIIIAPKMSGYEDWHLKISDLIMRRRPNTDDSVTLTYPVSVGAALYGIRATDIYLHPDISDYPPSSTPEYMDRVAAWFTTEVACRLGPEAQIQFFSTEDACRDANGWDVFLKDASKFMDGQRGIYAKATEKVTA